MACSSLSVAPLRSAREQQKKLQVVKREQIPTRKECCMLWEGRESGENIWRFRDGTMLRSYLSRGNGKFIAVRLRCSSLTSTHIFSQRMFFRQIILY